MMYSLVRWGIFAVAIALLPILISILGSVTRGDHVGFVELLKHGELFLVSAAIVGAGLADLVGEGGPRFRALKLTTGGAAGLVAITAAVWFADVAAGRRDGLQLDSSGIAVGSLIVFACALVAGASCIVVAEFAKKA
jgi:hypothetical protein